MGGIFSINGRRKAQLVTTGVNRRSNIIGVQLIARNQKPNASIQHTQTLNASFQTLNASFQNTSSDPKAQRNSALCLESGHGASKMILRSVPVHDKAQMLDLLSRAKTLCMDGKRRKQITRRRRVRKGAKLVFFGLELARGVIDLGDMVGFDAPDIPFLDGGNVDAGVEPEDGACPGEHDGNGESDQVPGERVHEPADEQPQDRAHDVDNDPSIPPELKASFLAANRLGAMRGAGLSAQQLLAANWNVRTLRANIAKLRQHTVKEILPHLPVHHSCDISWVKVKVQ